MPAYRRPLSGCVPAVLRALLLWAQLNPTGSGRARRSPAGSVWARLLLQAMLYIGPSCADPRR